MLPTCHACNELIRGKGNQFPIIDESNRQREPSILADGRLDENSIKANTSPLIDERPYLLHPEIDEPKHFFKFKENGRIKGTDDEGRGEETIKICNLNRGNLKVARQTIIDDYYQIINDALYRFYNLLKTTDKKIAQTQLRTDLKLIFQRLETQQNSNYQYSLFSWYIFENFEDIVIPLFSNLEHKKVISNAFSLYRTGNFN